MQKTQNKHGFTLTEIMVTIVIAGVIASLAIPRFSFTIEKSKLSEGLNIANALLNAQIAHFYENQTYADTIDALDIEIPASSNFDAIDDDAINNADETELVAVTRTGDLYIIYAGLNGGSTVINCDDSGGAQAGVICNKLGLP